MKITITADNNYQLQTDASDLETINVLESVLFDLKAKNRLQQGKGATEENAKATLPEPQVSPRAQLVTRIAKAVDAIRELGGEAEMPNVAKMTDAELQSDFDELSNQWRRLKNSKKK